MKNQKLCIMGIFIVSIVLILLVKNNSKTYIMYDGAMLALTLDGTPVTSLPSDSNKYNVSIECDNGVEQYLPVLENNSYNMKITIKNIAKEGVKCNIDFTTINDSNKNNYLLSNEVQSRGTEISSTNNNEETDVSYRYTGKQPNNFVWYNNELWRIIGLIPTCTSSDCSTKENLVKIIRNEVLGGYAYHSSNANTLWGSGNTLYTLLNEKYYGKLDATGSSPCFGYSSSGYAICNYTNKGISSDSSDYYGRMIKNVYMNGGTVSDTSTSIDNTYKLETATQTVLSKIGLMNASDYGYATSGITYSSVNISSLGGYTKNNWLYSQGYEWTMAPYSSSKVIAVGNTGGGIITNNARSGYSVRPVLYLDSDVYVISGNGTEANPYILAY